LRKIIEPSNLGVQFHLISLAVKHRVFVKDKVGIQFDILYRVTCRSIHKVVGLYKNIYYLVIQYLTFCVGKGNIFNWENVYLYRKITSAAHLAYTGQRVVCISRVYIYIEKLKRIF